ncbi:heat-inducible transcriptional repressor HrcA [Bacteroidota bacterium]
MQKKTVYIPKSPGNRELSEREKDVLRRVIQLYILKASPVGSRTLSKNIKEDLSPATIRNVMSDLEELEFISHPHTSAGRIPTDKGYRFYVDSLVELESLTKNEILALETTLKHSETVYKDASKILGILSSYLSVVALPHLIDLKVLKIELISLFSNKLLIIIALDSNFVKTVTLEVDFEIENKQLDQITGYINERISGKPLIFIRDNFKEMLMDFELKDTPLMRLFFDSIDNIFDVKNTKEKIHIAGTPNLLEYPEFGVPERLKGIIELLENEDVIIHLLDKYQYSEKGIQVLIGKEMEDEMLEDYSLVVSKYKFDSASGSIGIIGPKRMPYSKMMSLVKYVAEFITKSS